MPTERQLELQAKMREKVNKLKQLNYPKDKLEKLIKSLDLPLGSQLDLMR